MPIHQKGEGERHSDVEVTDGLAKATKKRKNAKPYLLNTKPVSSLLGEGIESCLNRLFEESETMRDRSKRWEQRIAFTRVSAVTFASASMS